MRQRGRESGAKAQVAGVTDIASVARPHAPDALSESESKLFNSIVASRPVDFFDCATVPLLVEYCRIPTEQEIVSESISAFQADWLSSDAGLKRFKELTAIRDKAQKRMALLATKMRLAQQSRYISDSRKARPAPEGGAPKPWED